MTYEHKFFCKLFMFKVAEGRFPSGLGRGKVSFIRGTIVEFTSLMFKLLK